MVLELIKIFNESRLATFFSVNLTCIPDNEILCLGRMGLTLSGSFSNVNLLVYNLLHWINQTNSMLYWRLLYKWYEFLCWERTDGAYKSCEYDLNNESSLYNLVPLSNANDSIW